MKHVTDGAASRAGGQGGADETEEHHGRAGRNGIHHCKAENHQSIAEALHSRADRAKDHHGLHQLDGAEDHHGRACGAEDQQGIAEDHHSSAGGSEDHQGIAEVHHGRADAGV